MIQLSTIPQYKKLHKEKPERVFILLHLIIAKPVFLKLCGVNFDDPYPFQQGKVKYSNYICCDIGKLRFAIPKDNIFALGEMINAKVDWKITANYLFNNLYATTND